jgi:hypothetical protein
VPAITPDEDALGQLAAAYADHPARLSLTLLSLLVYLMGAVEGAQGSPDPAAAIEVLGAVSAKVERVLGFRR